MVDMAHIAGLVAAGVHPSPVPHADVVTTTTHKTLRGPRGGIILATEEHAKAVDKAVFPGTQGGPLMHIIAAKAVAFREALDPSFQDYARQIVANARALGEGLMEARVPPRVRRHRQPPHPGGPEGSGRAHRQGCRARPRGAGITVNKNTVPGEPRSPFVTSGLRIGTPALTTRGMKEAEMRQVATGSPRSSRRPLRRRCVPVCAAEVRELAGRFPLYPELTG
jgi:glycine hydroxymethyltransferase